ncbi:MAG: MFS transporter [Bacteroidia bacterium]|nr:MFS transporter [Bacteroidia bacterium]
MSTSASTEIKINDKKTINGWALFDWANSAYALVITTAIFPGYFLQVTDSRINILGFQLSNSALYAFSISAAYFLIALFSPLLSGIADYGGKRKFFLRFFTTLGSLACISLFWFQGMGQLTLGILAFILATIGFAGGLVFYNSYLPLIASKERLDTVSAKGFAYGYVGSVILLITNLIIIMNPGWFGISQDSVAVRIAFVMVGLWWFGFAQITFKRLPNDRRKTIHQNNIVQKGYQELLHVWQQLKGQFNTKRFLLAFFCYSAGAQTVIFLAATFAEKELQFATEKMILLVLILQIVAIGGAYLFAKISDRKGNKFSLSIILVIWTFICFTAYFVHGDLQFYILAAFVGLVMGGVQSMSRSTYSKLLPTETKDTTSYFSFYDVLEKVAIIVGTFSFGFIEQLTGGMRNSVLTLAIFFLVGILILSKITVEPARIKDLSD